MGNVLKYFLCMCVFFFSRAPDCDVDAVVGWWVCLFGNGFQEVSKCVRTRSLSVGSKLLRQFSACRPLNRNLNSYFTVLLHHFFCVCAFSYPLAHLNVIFDAVVGGSVFSGTNCSP